MTYLADIQESINACYDYRQFVDDEDIAQIIEYYFDEIERFDTLEFVDPEGGKILIEWHFPESQFENDYDDEEDFESCEIDYPDGPSISDCFDIIRISDD